MAANTVRRRGTDSSGRGIFATDYMWSWWKRVCKDLGVTPVITQGAWMVKNGGGAKASAGYHDGGGTFDLRVWNLTDAQVAKVVRTCRRYGAAAWLRNLEHGGFTDPHIHFVLPTDTGLSPGARWQWSEYLAGRDGLASRGRDYHWRPDPLVAKPPPGRKPVRELEVGMWNLRVGRDPAVVVSEVRQFLDDRDLDVLLVSEAYQYVGALRKALKGKYRVGTFWARGKSARDSAVISRVGLRTGRRYLHRLERKGWERRPGRKGLHWARSAVSRNVAGIRFIARHDPPGPFGPRFPLRKLANETSFRTMTRLGRRLNKAGRPWVDGPDKNRLKSDPVSQEFLDATGATAYGSGIDWAAASGVKVSDMRTHDFGTSDHRPKTFTVTKETR